MPVQTRAKAPTERIYYSPAAQQQVRFRPRKQHVTHRRTLGASHKSRQQTLTQIDFVNLQEALQRDNDDNYIDYEEEEQSNRRKRRRTSGEAPPSSSNFYTQTLTQLEFVSTPASRDEDFADVENFDEDSTNLKHESNASVDHKIYPSKTPKRRRVFEIPSSQSPFSPLSARSQKFSNTRSPLKTLDINLQRHSISPARNLKHERSPILGLRIEDTFDYENESQQSRIPQTPNYMSSPVKSAYTSGESRVLTVTQRCFRDEIMDSEEEEEEEEEDMETCYNTLIQESQNESCFKHEISSKLVTHQASNTSPSDTQEAENQLQSTTLQFTHHVPSAAIATEEDEEQEQPPFVRPSQATTVSQSQPVISSPVFLRRPNEYVPPEEETFPDGQDGDRVGDQTDVEVEEGEGLSMITIPDPPSQHLSSNSLRLSPRQRKPRRNRGNQTPTDTQQRQQKLDHNTKTISDLYSSPSIKAARPRPIIQSSATTNPNTDSNPITSPLPPPSPFSLLPSSQFLTRSQMLPDSLMNESVPSPPPLHFLIEDSEMESDFDESE